MSASRTASATGRTLRPAASAFSQLLDPLRRPTRTSTPESLRFRAWACPWEPKPKTATFLPRMKPRSASCS